MEIAREVPAPSLRADWLAHARGHPATALGLGVAVLAVLWLLGLSVWRVALGEADAVLRLGLMGGFALMMVLDTTLG